MLPQANQQAAFDVTDEPNKKQHFGRGRKKRSRKLVAMHLAPDVISSLEQLAVQQNCLYAGKPQLSGLLSKVGQKELLLVPTDVLELLAPYLAELYQYKLQQFLKQSQVVHLTIGESQAQLDQIQQLLYLTEQTRVTNLAVFNVECSKEQRQER